MARPQRQWPRHLRSLLYAGIFGGIGLALGRSFDNPPEPGTAEDELELQNLREEFEELEVVADMREDPDFVEWEAYSNWMRGDKEHRLTSGPMSGSRGLAIQVGCLVFFHRYTPSFSLSG
jgi:ubiquitin carboxyl-terminal hydrolase 14